MSRSYLGAFCRNERCNGVCTCNSEYYVEGAPNVFNNYQFDSYWFSHFYWWIDFSDTQLFRNTVNYFNITDKKKLTNCIWFRMGMGEEEDGDHNTTMPSPSRPVRFASFSLILVCTLCLTNRHVACARSVCLRRFFPTDSFALSAITRITVPWRRS